MTSAFLRRRTSTTSRTRSWRGCAGARRVLAVSHENPDADTLGATLAIVRIVEALGGTADPVCTDEPPPLYAFMPGVERFRTDPDPTATYDLLVISDCGALSRVGDVGVRHADLFASLPRVIVDHHASNDAAEAGDWIEPGSAATCEMVTLLAARLGVPLTADDGALAADLIAGIVMDTSTFAHPNVTPRTLAVGAPRSWTPERRCRTPRRGCIGPSRRRSCDCSVGSWSGSRARTTAGSSGPRSRTTTSRRPGAARAHSEGIIDLLSQSDDGRGRDPVQGGRRGHPDQRPNEARWRGRDRPDRALRWWRACPCVRRQLRRSDRSGARRGRGRGASARRRRPALGAAETAWLNRRSGPGSMASWSSTSRPDRPRTTSSR